MRVGTFLRKAAAILLVFIGLIFTAAGVSTTVETGDVVIGITVTLIIGVAPLVLGIVLFIRPLLLSYKTESAKSSDHPADPKSAEPQQLARKQSRQTGSQDSQHESRDRQNDKRSTTKRKEPEKARRGTVTATDTDFARSMSVFAGLLQGVASDGQLHPSQEAMLRQWLSDHPHLLEYHPFSRVSDSLSKMESNSSERKQYEEDFIAFCHRLNTQTDPVEQFTADIRTLHGFVQGIASNEDVSVSELQGLKAWMDQRSENQDKWPFKQIREVVTRVLSDGKVSSLEKQEVLSLFSQFEENKVGVGAVDETISSGGWMKTEAPTLESIDSICDSDARVEIRGRTFCITGQAKHGTRKELYNLIDMAGGITKQSVTQDLDYLVIGSNSNPAWAYSKYGRKVEEVMNNRERGANTMVIHESRLASALGIE